MEGLNFLARLPNVVYIGYALYCLVYLRFVECRADETRTGVRAI